MIHDWAFTDSHYVLLGNRIKLDIPGKLLCCSLLTDLLKLPVHFCLHWSIVLEAQVLSYYSWKLEALLVCCSFFCWALGKNATLTYGILLIQRWNFFESGRIVTSSVRPTPNDISTCSEPQPTLNTNLCAAPFLPESQPRQELACAHTSSIPAMGTAHRECIRGKGWKWELEDPAPSLCMLLPVVEFPQDVR